MKLTHASEKNVKFIFKHYKELISFTKSNNKYLKKIYNDFKHAETYVAGLKKELSVKEITNISDIEKPTSYNGSTNSFFPEHIKSYINNNCIYYLCVSLEIEKRKFDIYFYLCHSINDLDIFKKYVDLMAMWLYMASIHSSTICAETLSIYVYLSPYKKVIPESEVDIMGANHVNTAFTTSCTKNGEIIIYRQEEWFKVFIHETFHVFGLDFSNVNSDYQKTLMKQLFPIQSKFNIEESYCEFWARILNICFFSYENFKSYKEFKVSFEINIELEKIHSMIQLTKVLKFMGLSYDNMCNETMKHICNNLYKENSNVFAYYVLTSILLNNYNETIQWCYNNNIMLYRFKKTPNNITNYVKLIESLYKKKKYLTYTKKIHKMQDNSTMMSFLDFQ